MLRKKDLDHSFFYILGLSILVIGLPWSPFLISLSQAILLTNWILEGNFRYKFTLLLKRRSAILIISIFILHLVGIIYSADIQLALKDIKIKLPLFIFPLVMATTKPISFNQLRTILNLFLITIFISTVLSLLALLGFTQHEIVDVRNISLFISHILFGLLINVSIFSTVYLFHKCDCKKAFYYKFGYGLLLFWLIVFLFILQSLTGIIIFVITSAIILIWWSLSRKNKILKYIGWGTTVFIPVFIISFLSYSFNEYYSVEVIDYKHLELTTFLGNKYEHNTKSQQIENGNYVWLYVCDSELKDEWSKRSNIDFNAKDKKGHLIRLTIIRFLTSKGVRKDAAGISALSNDEVKYIENGYANHIYMNRFGIYPRVYQIIWEIDNYMKGKNPSGYSVAQRFEYIKSALHIFKNNTLIGVGTGDLKQAYEDYYNNSNSVLTQKWRLRAHNQYLTFLVSFGIIGFLWIVIAFTYSIYFEKGFKSYFFIMFLIIALLSMLNEDTLETQTGVTFVAFFFSLFLFGYKTPDQPDSF